MFFDLFIDFNLCSFGLFGDLNAFKALLLTSNLGNLIFALLLILVVIVCLVIIKQQLCYLILLCSLCNSCLLSNLLLNYCCTFKVHTPILVQNYL
jgi:hypothetical protein